MSMLKKIFILTVIALVCGSVCAKIVDQNGKIELGAPFADNAVLQ